MGAAVAGVEHGVSDAVAWHGSIPRHYKNITNISGQGAADKGRITFLNGPSVAFCQCLRCCLVVGSGV